MMSGFGYRLLYGADIGRGGRSNSLWMCVPVADKMQSLLMHFVDLPLFLASVGKIQISRPAICWSWTGNAGDLNLMIRESSEKLASGLQ